MEINKEQLKGYLDTIVLTIILKNDMYGYEIFKKVKLISNNKFEIKESTLYIVLKRLENKGLIYSYWNDCTSYGGRRKYHKITTSGKDYLLLKKQEWYFFQNILNKFFEECYFE